MSGGSGDGPVKVRPRWVVVGLLAFVVCVISVGVYGKNDLWRVALAGYLTGAGTLVLAVVAYLTMVQEARDRREPQAFAQRDRERAERVEARERRRLEREQARRQDERVQITPAKCLGGASNHWQFQTAINNRSGDPITLPAMRLGGCP